MRERAAATLPKKSNTLQGNTLTLIISQIFAANSSGQGKVIKRFVLKNRSIAKKLFLLLCSVTRWGDLLDFGQL